MALDVRVGGVAAVGTMVETWRMMVNHLIDDDNSENRPSDRNIAGVGGAAYFLWGGGRARWGGVGQDKSKDLQAGRGRGGVIGEFFMLMNKTIYKW